MRERRTIFGEAADPCDKARAPYPDALIDDVLAAGEVPLIEARGGEVAIPHATFLVMARLR